MSVRLHQVSVWRIHPGAWRWCLRFRRAGELGFLAGGTFHTNAAAAAEAMFAAWSIQYA